MIFENKCKTIINETNKKEKGYDSTVDAKAHIEIIQKIMNKVIDSLKDRSINHDKSKLEDPERSMYDKYIPMLKTTKYGSEEYYDIREKMQKEGLDHHYEVNSHHPEHYENGIDGMDLIDLIEMYCDWKAASSKSDTSFEKGLESNAKRFKMSDQLLSIFKNTSKNGY